MAIIQGAGVGSHQFESEGGGWVKGGGSLALLALVPSSSLRLVMNRSFSSIASPTLLTPLSLPDEKHEDAKQHQ